MDQLHEELLDMARKWAKVSGHEHWQHRFTIQQTIIEENSIWEAKYEGQKDFYATGQSYEEAVNKLITIIFKAFEQNRKEYKKKNRQDTEIL